MAATIKQIAERSGLSIVTVSRILSGNEADYRPETRERVRQAAQELRYTRNELARALRRRRTDVIGLYLWDRRLDTHGPFLAEIVSGLQRGCEAHHKDLLIHGTFRGEAVGDIFARLVNGRIDGLALFAEPGDPLVERLAAAALPAITVADRVPPLPGVVADDRAGTRLLVDYLAARGHRRIHYRTGPAFQTSTARRYEAFCEAAAAHGIATSEDADLSELPAALFRAPAAERPSAILCWNDDAADRAVAQCAALGLRVPGDVAVAGFDGLISPRRPARRLTTVRAPWSEVARTAVDLLITLSEGGTTPDETTLPVELVVGDTA